MADSSLFTPCKKEGGKKILCSIKVFEYLYAHLPLGSLVVVAVNKQERQGSKGPHQRLRMLKSWTSVVEKYILLAGSSFAFPSKVLIPGYMLLYIIEGLRSYPTTTALNCLKLLGHMAACMYVIQHTGLQFRPLQAWLISVY